MPAHDPPDFSTRRDELLDDVYRLAARIRMWRVVGFGMPVLLVLTAMGLLVLRQGGQQEGINVAASGPAATPSTIGVTTVAPTAMTQPPPGSVESAVVPTTVPPISASSPTTTTMSISAPTWPLEPATTVVGPNPQRPQPQQPGSRVSFEPGLWRLRGVGADGRTLTIAVLEEGCLTFDHVEVSEGSAGVTLAAILRRVTPLDPNAGCGDLRGVHVAVVPLSSPLGGRDLIGQCVPGDSFEGRQCSSLG